jgi:hypothetical protein
MLWVKLHVGIHRNPKIRRGGRDVRDLFVLLLCINGEHDFGGVIPAAYCAPDLLADDLGVTHETAGNALKRGETVGLFQRNEAGDLAISGFSDEWMPIKGSSTERVRAFRARHRNHTSEAHAVTHETVTETPSVSYETRNGDKRREEEKREEEIREEPPTVGRVLELPLAPPPRLDMNRVYAEYPRKEGKSKGLAKLAKALRTPSDLESCIAAARAYAAHCAISGQYLKHFDTWTSEWEDWVPGEDGRPANGAVPASQSRPSATGAKTYSPAEMAQMARAEFERERGGSR